MNLFELFAKISLDSTGFEAALNAAGKALSAATAAVSAFAGASVKVGQEFDKSMSQVAATMGYTVEQLSDATSEEAKNFKRLRDFAQEMGATTAFTASEAADALNYMALAGYDAETSMKMLPNVLNLAASGGIDLASASDMITDAQSALGLSLKQTNTLVDQMAKTASKSNTSVAQLGDAILTIGGTADLMAGSTNHLNTVLGLLADNGIKGSEAGTHLRNMILKLSAPTKEGAEAMEALGLQVFNSEGKMRDFQDIFADLNTAFADLTDEQKINYISELFNARDISAVNALLNTTTERWDELGLAINQSTDAADAMAKTQLDNLSGDVTIFKSALEGAQIVLSDKLTPGLRNFVQFGTKAVTNLSNAFKTGDFSGAMAALGDILSEGLGMVLKELPSLVDAGASLLMSLGQGILENLPILAESMLQVVQMLGAKLVENLPIFAATLSSVISEIALYLSNPETLTALLGTFLTIMQTLAQTIIENSHIMIETMLQVIDNLVAFMLENLPTFVDTAAQFIMALVDGFIQALPALLEYLPTVIDSMVTTWLTMTDYIVDTGVKLLTALIQKLPYIIDIIVAKIPDIIDSIVSALTDLIPTIVDTGVRVLTALVDNMPTILATLAEAAPVIIDKIVDAIIDLLPTIVQTGIDLFVALIRNLPQAITTIVSHLPEIITAIVNGIGELLPQLWQAGKDLIAGLWNGINDAKEWLREKISGFFGGVVDSIKAFFGIKSPSKLFAGIGEMLDRGLAKGVEDYADLAVSAAEDMADSVFDATDRDYDFTATGHIDENGNPIGKWNAPVINVYGSEGQDVSELAEIVSERIAFTYLQEQAVWA